MDFSKNDSAQIVEPPVVTDFMNYREFLQKYFDYKQTLTRNSLRPYSWSDFSAAADLKSPNYLRMVIEGQRNLSIKMAERFGFAMQLSRRQVDEFRTLVQYNQATDPAERNHFLKELNQIRLQNKLKSGDIRKEDWQKWPDWVGWVLYAMIDQKGVQANPVWIRKLMREKVSLEELRKSIKTLLDLGLIEVNVKTGLWEKAKSFIEGADEIPVDIVRKLQSQLMELGLESLYRDPAEEREFGSLTLALTRHEFEELRFQLRKIRKQVHKDQSIRRMSTKGDRVYQLNIQLFPVTEFSAETGVSSMEQADSKANPSIKETDDPQE